MKRGIEAPPRLEHDDVLGPAMRDAASRQMSDGRLRTHQRRIDRYKKNPPTAPSSVAGYVVGGIVIAGAIGAAVVWDTSTSEAPRFATTPQSVRQEEASQSSGPESVLSGESADDTKDPVDIVAPRVVEPSSPKAPSIRARPKQLSGRGHAQGMGTHHTDSHKSEVQNNGTLAPQLELYNAATTQAAAGDYVGALARLGELEQRYPEGVLQHEARLKRADYLTRARRFDEAITVTQSLIKAPQFATKRAELWLLLGDLWVNKNSCDNARGAYELALNGNLPAAQRAAAVRGLEGCAGGRVLQPTRPSK